MTHLSLFTGIGGIDLAAEMAGFCTVGQVEIDDYCNRVLEHHWPGVPRWRDVKDVTAETFEQKTGIKPGTLAVLSGGFPCQPVSCAGKRKGDADERWLWDEMLRVICEVRPRWVVAENVRGLLSAKSFRDGRHLFGRVLRDLAQNGYRVGWLCYGAGDVGAPHKRERVFIVAHSRGGGFGKQGICREQQRGAEAISTSEGSCWLVADTNNPGSRTPYGGTNENRSGEEVKEREEQPQSRPCRFSQDVADTDSKQTNKQLCPSYRSCRQQGQAVEAGEKAARPQDGKAGNNDTSRFCEALADTPQHLLNRPRQARPAGRGEFADVGAGPTQPRLGNSPDGFPAGLAGHRWPAGRWPTPKTRSNRNSRQAIVDEKSGGKHKSDLSLMQAVEVVSGILPKELKSPDELPPQWKQLWPAGPGEQHEWEPPRIATGVKDRVAKLKALGNAVVPAQAYPIFRAIMEIEEAIP